jgi:putative transposase
MSRVARVVVPGFPHHVTQRGNRRADVFADDDDRKFYLALLRTYAIKHGVDFWAYCLMPNHVHFIAVPSSEGALGAVFHDTHSVYTLHFNRRSGLSGHVFQGRFYSTALDDDHLWAAVRYVERNPVRAGIVDHAPDYRWSSAPAHCNSVTDRLLAGDFPPSGTIEDWSTWLRSDEEDTSQSIRQATRIGRPCGSADFIAQVEKKLGRSLTPKKRGRRPRA